LAKTSRWDSLEISPTFNYTFKDMLEDQLRIIPFYTGDKSLDEALRNKKSLKMLWLEILFNDRIPWEDYFNIQEIKIAHEKASIWYHHFKTMVDWSVKRKPLGEQKGEIDEREYRKFLEVLNFVSG
jgi:hypothetical protein